MATPLPVVDCPLVQHIADEDLSYLEAYKICLKYEREHAASKNKLRCVRIVGFLLLHAPNQGVRSEVAKCIHSCKDDSDLTELGAFFEHYVILPFKKYKGWTPNSSIHSSRSSFEDSRAAIKVNITQAPKDHKDAKYCALTRDNWRCVITGVIDERVSEEIAQLDWMTFAVSTECVHIIPEAVFFGVEPHSTECGYLASILAILKQFYYNINMFNGKNIHSLTNVLTLRTDPHNAFNRLRLYFEAMPQENCYKVKWFGPRPADHIPPFITFSTPDCEHLPVPAPELLAMHATCCKVAHFSGATAHIEEIYCDADERGVLSSDGASQDILSYKLLSLLKPV